MRNIKVVQYSYDLRFTAYEIFENRKPETV